MCEKIKDDQQNIPDFLKYGRGLFVDCVLNNREYILSDIYVFSEVYSYGGEIPERVLILLKKYIVDYEKISEVIKEYSFFYQCSNIQLHKMKILKKEDIRDILETICTDMDLYVRAPSYLCKSNIMRKIQKWR